MQSLDVYLKGEQAPPKKPVNWTRVIVGAVVGVLLIAIVLYAAIQGQRAGDAVWMQLGRNLDQRTQVK